MPARYEPSGRYLPVPFSPLAIWRYTETAEVGVRSIVVRSTWNSPK